MQATYRLAIASFVFHVLALVLGWGVVKWTSAQADDLHHAAELSTLHNKMVSTAVKATNTALAWSAGSVARMRFTTGRKATALNDKRRHRLRCCADAAVGRQAMWRRWSRWLPHGFLFSGLLSGGRDSAQDRYGSRDADACELPPSSQPVLEEVTDELLVVEGSGPPLAYQINRSRRRHAHPHEGESRHES